MAKFTETYLNLRKKFPAEVLILVRASEEFYEAYGDDAFVIGEVCGFWVASDIDGVARVGFPEDNFEKVVTKLIRSKNRVVICDEPVLINE